MGKKNLIVLLIVVVLLGISTGFIGVTLVFSNFGNFMVVLLGILYTYWMGGPGGNSGTGNGENSIP
ncbi:hypothetical protein OR571_05565 [Psychrobacillus sp. NEAU-3TGS]|uniref:hypothetical protein n=1 Tax=Psychrobacillus sp. NEAU-3TGS TaxID=2995412 RepID=UPI002495D733|nr:hypothetical protein [Psychrobacillus sp. NEAU-3TGS]MDI2586614.1 hypothetical protein [Psychrobacillus sp. NEAU-3TGS]